MTDNCSDVIRTEIHRLSTVLPTMWIGAQNGRSVVAVIALSLIEDRFPVCGCLFLLDADAVLITVV